MSIKHGTTSITAVKHGTTSLTAVYHASTKVFPDTATVSIGLPIVGRTVVGKIFEPVYFTNSDIWISTSSTATSGSTSGTFNVGVTVYGFVKVKSFHNTIPSGWTLISGTTYMQNAIYRTGSITVDAGTSSYNLTSGTIMSPVTIVALKKLFFGYADEGTFSSDYPYAFWPCWYPYENPNGRYPMGSFSANTTMTISGEISGSPYPNEQYLTHHKELTWSGSTVTNACYAYSNYDAEPLTAPMFYVYSVDNTGIQTTIVSGSYTFGSISLSTTYAYFIFKEQDIESSTT